MKRMTSTEITRSDAFLTMPASSRLLYYDLNQEADDDGFVGNPKTILRVTGASEDDLNVLLAKKFILIFESGVIVIKGFFINNTIRTDRKKPTTYQTELKQLTFKENGSYTLKNSQLNLFNNEEIVECQPNDNQMTTKCQPNDNLSYIKLSYIKLNKDNKKEILKKENSKENTPPSKNFITPSLEEIKEYCEERNNLVDFNRFYDFYQSKGWMVGKNKMKDWRAAVRTWEKEAGFKTISNKETAQEDVEESYQDALNELEEMRKNGGK